MYLEWKLALGCVNHNHPPRRPRAPAGGRRQNCGSKLRITRLSKDHLCKSMEVKQKEYIAHCALTNFCKTPSQRKAGRRTGSQSTVVGLSHPHGRPTNQQAPSAGREAAGSQARPAGMHGRERHQLRQQTTISDNDWIMPRRGAIAPTRKQSPHAAPTIAASHRLGRLDLRPSKELAARALTAQGPVGSLVTRRHSW